MSSTWAFDGTGYTSSGRTLTFATTGAGAFENLFGGTANDVFNISTSHTGIVNGGAGNDTLDWSGSVQFVQITLLSSGTTDGIQGDLTPLLTMTGPGFDNFEEFIGNATSTFLGGSANTTVTIDGVDSFTVTSGVFGSVSLTNVGSITGGDGDDDVTFDGGTLSGDIDGGAGDNTLTADDVPNLWTFTGTSGTVTGLGGSFSNIDNITGGSATDQFTVVGAAIFAATIDGGTGSNTLIGGDVANDWNLSGPNQGDIGGILSFNQIQQLVGGSNADTFNFSNTSTFSSLDAAAGIDILDYAAVTTPVTVDLVTNSVSFIPAGQAANFEQVVGGAGAADTLIGENNPNTWNLTATGTGTVDGFVFSAIENLTGGAAADILDYSSVGGPITFDLATNAASLIGGIATSFEELIGSASSTDTLIGENDPNTWNVTGSASGTVDGFVFSTIENLVGGMSAFDTLSFADGAAVAVVLTGLGTDNGFAGAETGNLVSMFDNMNSLIGSSGIDSLTGLDADSTWMLDGTNYASSGRTLTFPGSGVSAIENLSGGSAADTFDISTSRTGNIDGGDGANTFNLGGTGTLVTGSLSAGAGDDTFNFNSNASITGTLDGGAGVDALDWSGSTLDVVFALPAIGTIDGVRGDLVPLIASTGAGFDNINAFTASATALSTFSGNNDDTNITVDGVNSFTGDSNSFASVSFTNFDTIITGVGDDDFTFAGGTLAGAIDGGNGANTLTADNGTNLWTITGAADGTMTGLGESFINIDDVTGGTGDDEFTVIGTSAFAGTIDGGAGTNTLVGGNLANNWTLSGIDQGDIDGSSSFMNISHLVGGSDTDTFNIGAPNQVTGDLNGGGGDDTLRQTFASDWRITTSNGGTTNGVTGTFLSVETLTAVDSTTNLDLDGASITGTYTATQITLDADGESVTGGTPVTIVGDLLANTSQTISTGGSAFSVSGSLTGAAGYTINAGGGVVSVGGETKAGALIIFSGGATLQSVMTNGEQTYNGPATFSSDLTGGSLTFNGPSTFTGDVRMRSSTNITNFNGAVSGTGNLDIIPTSNTDIFIDTGGGVGHIAANQFSGFQGHLIIGAELDPLDSPAEDAVVINPPGVTADRITVAQEFVVGGDVTLIGSNIDLNAGVAGPPGTGQVTLIAVGDSQSNGGEGPGDITGPTGGTAVIGGGKAVLIANNGVVNAGNIRLDLSGGDLLLAISASQDEPVFDPSSSATSVDFDPTTIAIIASLGLNLQSVQVVFSNPAAALTGLQNVQFIDVGLFEEDLSLFGVIGNGIALSLDQCEEAEGCAPNVSAEEIDALIAQIEGRISEIERRLAAGAIDADEGQRLLAGFRQELANCQMYKQQLADFEESEQGFGDDFGELDDFAEEFDDVLPVEAEDDGGTEPAEFEEPQLAAPEPEPEPEPAEEAFEELEDEFTEQEIPADEFEDLDEDLEEDFLELDDELDIAPDEFENLDDELDEFEELGTEIDHSLLLRLTQHSYVNQYRGAVGIGSNGRVVWTGDIVLPSSARQY